MSENAKNLNTEVAVKVLIIANKKNQFSNAAQFLIRRGVPCAIKGNIRESIQYITKEKPTAVFLSWNLPNSNVVKTYQLITKALNTKCVVFAEKGDGKTSAELNNSKIPDVMHAPVSGPGFFMRLQKLLKSKDEEKTPKKRLTQLTQKVKKTPNLKINIKSSKEVPTDGTWEQTGVDPADGQPIYTFKSSSSQSHGGKPGFYTFKGPKPPTLSADGTWATESGSFEFSQETQESANYVNFQSGESTEEMEEESSDPEMNDISDLLTSVDLNETETLEATLDDSSADNNIDDLIQDGGADNSTEVEIDVDLPAEKSYGSVLNVAKKKKKATYEMPLPEYEVTKPKEALITGDEKKKHNYHDSHIIEPQIKSKVPNSILLDKTYEALRKSVRPAQAEHKLVEVVSKAKVLNIHSMRFRGYLIAVIPQFKEMDRNVFSNLKESLFNLLNEQGEELKHLEELNVDLEDVDFKKWCDEHAEFQLATLDNDQEIILAYVPIDQTLPSVEDSHEKMAQVKAQDLEVNSKTKFNLFLHLPKNNKFVKYLKPGDTVTEKHAGKFEKHKVQNLHINKEEVKSFKEYFASNQLQKKGKKKAS